MLELVRLFGQECGGVSQESICGLADQVSKSRKVVDHITLNVLQVDLTRVSIYLCLKLYVSVFVVAIVLTTEIVVSVESASFSDFDDDVEEETDKS